MGVWRRGGKENGQGGRKQEVEGAKRSYKTQRGGRNTWLTLLIGSTPVKRKRAGQRIEVCARQVPSCLVRILLVHGLQECVLQLSFGFATSKKRIAQHGIFDLFECTANSICSNDMHLDGLYRHLQARVRREGSVHHPVAAADTIVECKPEARGRQR